MIFSGPPEDPWEFLVVPDSATMSSIDFTWYSGFHNGADQLFHLKYRVKDTTDWISGKTIVGGKAVRNQEFRATLSGLSPNVWYEFMMYASNTYGDSGFITTNGNTTAMKIGNLIYLYLKNKLWIYNII